MIFSAEFVCTNNETFGDGLEGGNATGACEENKVGALVAVCQANGVWEVIIDGCILLPVHNLLQQSEVRLFSDFMLTETGSLDTSDAQPISTAPLNAFRIKIKTYHTNLKQQIETCH